LIGSALSLGLLVYLATGCMDTARLPPGADTGPHPTLPDPAPGLLPTVHIAPARGWPEGGAPTPAAGLRVRAFARDLDHPRWLLALPNGDVLVAESNAPAKPAGGSNNPLDWVRGLVMGQALQRAGAAGVSADRITLLRDLDGDGVADLRTVLLSGLHSPFGMALVGDRLYVANTDAVLSFPYTAGVTTIIAPGTPVATLPAGPINHHWTKGLVASPDGRFLYVSVGANSNIAERGMAVEAGRAAVWQIDLAAGTQRLFASGLRNPVGMAWDAAGRTLWAVVNERDELGSDLVPDYLAAVQDGAFYGWPWSYWGAVRDTRVATADAEAAATATAHVATARVPDFALGAHVAPLGLAAAAPGAPASAEGLRQGEGMFVGLHGSWNRRPHSGYKVVFVPFAGGRPQGAMHDVLTNFLSPQGEAWGRPVGVALDRRGALLVADDVGNVVWRVTAHPRAGSNKLSLTSLLAAR